MADLRGLMYVHDAQKLHDMPNHTAAAMRA